MPNVTFDRQSFLIDAKRTWLVSGALHYARTPRGLWADRLRAARQAGLNCIETYVFWNYHETEPGRFDFTGERDLRAFVEEVGRQGMWCILRPGPYVCSEWDFGGLPASLHRAAREAGQPLKVRQADPVFLEAMTRYLRAVMEQVADLQATAPRQGQPAPRTPDAPRHGYAGQAGGPILMVQAENEWLSHHPEQQAGYLNRIVSALRQHGCKVPINNCNNLWQPIEGTIDTWNGSRDLPAMMRQVATLQPDAPRLVTEYWAGWFDAWGDAHSDSVDADLHTYRMAGITGVGAQMNLYMFHGGTNFGFFGGRTVASESCYMTTSYDYDAPLLEAGGRGDKYHATKRHAMFASQFGHVLAHLDSAQAVGVAPREDGHALSVLHQQGGQGGLITLLKAKNDRTAQTDLLLPNGLTLPVPLKGLRAAWLLLDTPLAGNATLDFTNLCPWAMIDGRLLVLFGPAGSEGVFSIDGQQAGVEVPKGKRPAIVELGEISVAVLNTDQVDAAYIGPDALIIGADGIGSDGNAIPLPGWATQTAIAFDGTTTHKRTTTPAAPAPPKLAGWETLPLSDYLDGTAERYQHIPGPATHEQLGQDFGYGWYRLRLTSPTTGKTMLPVGGDRLHLYVDGKLAALHGNGPGAEAGPFALKAQGQVVALTDNLGRFNFGQRLGQDVKGIGAHLYTVKPIKLGKPDVVKQPAGDPFAVEGYASQRRFDDKPMAQALVWSYKPTSRKPIVLEIVGLPNDAVLTINGTPTHYYAAQQSASFLRVLLDPADDGPFTGGTNEVKLALTRTLDDDADPAKQVRAYQTGTRLTHAGKPTKSGDTGWAFAPWVEPAHDDAGWKRLPKSTPSQPAWFRCAFSVNDTRVPLWLEPVGLTKGQLYLNGYNLGRYWQQTREGSPVGPQERYYLPEPWLNTDAPNTLLLFDEHGRAPHKCRLVYNPNGPYAEA
ncbi:MAG: beta-galactosidase [Phycisphaerales bacterium JB063]